MVRSGNACTSYENYVLVAAHCQLKTSGMTALSCEHNTNCWEPGDCDQLSQTSSKQTV
jgi:hypothetical protein